MAGRLVWWFGASGTVVMGSCDDEESHSQNDRASVELSKRVGTLGGRVRVENTKEEGQGGIKSKGIGVDPVLRTVHTVGRKGG